jgi:phosphoglycolate phosphatase-like HAD superfamily hydrolase
MSVRKLAAVAAVAALTAVAAAPARRQAALRCGIERWNVKTLTDPAARSVNFTPRATTVDALRALGIARFGVLTGRVRAEWDAIRARVPLPPDVAVATDEDGRKPEPRVLRALVERLGSSRPCYVGDVMDDWRLVAAYNERFPSRPASAVLVSADARSELALREAGATDFVRDVNEVPELLAARG